MGYIQLSSGDLVDCADVLDASYTVGGGEAPFPEIITIRYKFNMGSNKLLQCTITYNASEETAIAMNSSQIRAVWNPLIARMANEDGIIQAPVILMNDNTEANPGFTYGLSAALS